MEVEEERKKDKELPAGEIRTNVAIEPPPVHWERNGVVEELLVEVPKPEEPYPWIIPFLDGMENRMKRWGDLTYPSPWGRVSVGRIMMFVIELDKEVGELRKQVEENQEAKEKAMALLEEMKKHIEKQNAITSSLVAPAMDIIRQHAHQEVSKGTVVWSRRRNDETDRGEEG